MNKLNLLLVTGSIVALTGCMHSQKQADKSPAPTPAQVAATQLNNDRTDYVNRTQARIDELSKYSAELREKSATAAKPQKKKLENSADDLDSSLKDVTKSLDEVKQAAPENWLDYKRDVTKTMQSAETVYSNSVHLLQ